MEDNKHKHGFNEPEGYFEEFEDRLFLRMAEESLPKSSGFGVPNGYFDALEDSIMEKITSSEDQPKVIPLHRRRSWQYVAAIAACAALVFSIFNFRMGPGDVTLDQLELSSIESYLESGNIQWDSEDVIALMDDSQIDELVLTDELLSEEDLEEYLLEYIDDTSLLIE